MSNAKRNYLTDFDYRAHAHTASASQFESFLTCPRKWWFQKVARLPEIWGQDQFVFGDRLHEACERFLLGDDTGRDPETGEPIELWPEGWSEGLDEFDASLVKRLVERGIEEGILRRTPGRRVEAPVGKHNGTNYTPRQIVPGVGVCGYRDVAHPGVVEDHKSIKNRRYAKTQADLLADPQLLLYAAIDVIEQVEAGAEVPEVVTLRHNQFIKDPKSLHVMATEVDVPVSDVETFWNGTIEPAARDMLNYKRKVRDPDAWASVEGPRKKGACQQYGGCPFSRICGGVETPAAYKARIERVNSMPAESPLPELTNTEESDMGIFDRINKSTTKPQEPAKAPEPAVTAGELKPAPEEPEFEGDVPPWHNAECKACVERPGFNSKGGACAACDRVAIKEGRPRSSMFTIKVDDEGFAVWTSKAAAEVTGRMRVTSAEVTATERTKPASETTKAKGADKRKKAEPKPKPEAEIMPEIDPKADEEPAPEPEPAPKPDKPAVEPKATKAAPKPEVEVTDEITRVRGKGRSTGFILVYGAVRRAKMSLMDLNEIFARYAQELAASQGAESYYLLDRFKRRDLMAARAAQIAETIPSSSIVVVRADDADIRAFATAIEVYATNVIEGAS